jgi:nucleoside-diphosphate-sugar epimerase
MRVFVTGATGFIGFAVVQELLAAGHEVMGLARSAASGKKLAEAGAQVVVGSIEDVDCLRRAAVAADGAIHTAFYHKISHLPLRTRMRVLLGGAPGGIVQRFMKAAVEADRRALEVIGGSLLREGSPVVGTFATMALPEGRLATEEESYDRAFFGAPRAETEDTLKRLAGRGVRAMAVRLPPVVHGAGDHGFAERLIETAQKKNESAYTGDGKNRWPSVHRLDAARLFRLVLERGVAGGTYHGVAEEGIAFREIAGLIGEKLKVPVVSKSSADAARHFSFLAPFVVRDNPASSALTQERLGWWPEQMGLMADLKANYF